MEINTGKSQVMRVSKSNESLQIKVNNRELKEGDHFKYLGSVLTRDHYSVAYSSQGSHTGQLDFCNWLADGSTTG